MNGAPQANGQGNPAVHRAATDTLRRRSALLLSALTLLLLLAAPALAAFSRPAAAPAPLDDYGELVRRASARASALAAHEFTRALDAVTAVHGPQELRGFTPREVIERLRGDGWTDPMLPYDFDAAPLTLGPDQRFRPAPEPGAAPGDETDTDLILKWTEPGRITPELAERGLADERYAVRWYVLSCLAEYPGNGEQALAVLKAFLREPLPSMTRAYARALRPLPLYARLAQGADLPGLDAALARLASDPVLVDARCLGLLLASATGRSFPGADAALVLAQLARDYPVQSLEKEVRGLPADVLNTLADGLRHAWAQPQDRLVALLARFPEHGPSLEALAHALLNRNHPDYSASHRALVRTWEQLTGIDFKGNAEPFLQWYHAHKPMPGPSGAGG
ncbi:hypothetical protein [Paucidesulfovibrio longus]|uniref:hypothetical protein n=1 Tax=Paucidesulfovibrio longus TaxID=889 RepID=UPI0003B6D81D|nr:hypothetical protein [Paucidesulfovibrio longus]